MEGTGVPIHMFTPLQCFRTFTKVMKPVVSYLRSLGVRMIVYLDEIRILGQTKEELLKWRAIT